MRLRRAFAPIGAHPMCKHRDRRPKRTAKRFGRDAHRKSFSISFAIRCIGVMLSNLSTQFKPTQTRNTGLLPLPAPRADCTRAGARFRAHLAAGDYTPHSVRKHTKSSAKPCLSMGDTFAPGGSAISSRGQASFGAIAVNGCFAQLAVNGCLPTGPLH